MGWRVGHLRLQGVLEFLPIAGVRIPDDHSLFADGPLPGGGAGPRVISAPQPYHPVHVRPGQHPPGFSTHQPWLQRSNHQLVGADVQCALNLTMGLPSALGTQCGSSYHESSNCLTCSATRHQAHAAHHAAHRMITSPRPLTNLDQEAAGFSHPPATGLRWVY